MMPVMATKEEVKAHLQILEKMGGVEKNISSVKALQAAQQQAQRPISMLHGIPPPYFYGDEGEDVEAFIYALVNCANANDWKDHKTVNNLAHFLDGRAGYAFRAAVEHRVERAKGSKKERLEDRRVQLKRLTDLEQEKTVAGDAVRELAAILAKERAVKEEKGEDDDEETSPDVSEEMTKLDRKYAAALETYSEASVRYAQAKSKVKETDWLATAEDGSGTSHLVAESDHAIAFPTLASALQWLRATFRREDVEDRLTGEYFGRRQRKGERVQDYALELLKLCSRAGIHTTETKKTQHFVDGLRPRLKRTLRHYVLSGKVVLTEGNWEDTVREASKLEREHPFLTSSEEADGGAYYGELNAVGARQVSNEERAQPAAVAAPPNVDWSKLAADVAALTEAVQTDGDRPGKERNNQARAMICYNCHELGHMAWQCNKADSRQTRNYVQNGPRAVPFSVVCYNCNKNGHYASKCPEPRNGAAARPQGKGGQVPGGRPAERSNTQGQPRARMQGNGPRA